MTLTLLPAADRIPTSWKNGGGVTREVAASGESGAGSTLNDFRWRVSLADIAADGPFSAFDGYDRVITLVRGAGMLLTIDGVGHRVSDRFVPLAFPGGSLTDCALIDGPVVDMNVMTRVGAAEADVTFVRLSDPHAEIRVALDDVRAVAVAVLVDGHADVRWGIAATGLGELDAVVARGEHFEITTASRAVVALVRIDET
jgi:uncharacterized protein